MAALLVLSSCHSPAQSAAAKFSAIGLSTSLPLVWNESGDIRGELAGSGERHWAVRTLDKHGPVIPLDTLASPRGLALPADALLVLAQPRPLAPEENVALDRWVRDGGRVLLFADPMLTATSRFALGDARRPEAMVMLSPILRHWGLDLRFDPEQVPGLRTVAVAGSSLPVDLHGTLSATSRTCRIESDGLLADCAIGRGRAIVIADAALFDGEDAGRSAVLTHLLALIHR